MSLWKNGDVVWADLDPSAGHEQTKRRPVIVVSNDTFNRRSSLVVTVPITSVDSGYPLHLEVGVVPAESGGRPLHGWAEVEQLKSLDLDARNAVRVGHIDAVGMDRILSVIFGCLITPGMTLLPG